MEVTEKKENKKEISPLEQWDAVAFKLIQDTLAPKGFKQISNGRWRGLRIANADQPGIVKSKVNQCQRIAAQMVRTYREKAKAELRSGIGMAKSMLSTCKWWQWRLKRDYRNQIGAMESIIQTLDQISIK